MAIYQRGTTRTNEQAPVYPSRVDPAPDTVGPVAPVDPVEPIEPVEPVEEVPLSALSKDKLLAILAEAGAVGYSKRTGKDELLEAVRAIEAE